MRSRLPSCVFFDLDGTIVDSLPGIEFSVAEAFEACKLSLPRRNLRSLIGPPIREILARVGNISEQSQLDALERAFRASYDSKGWQMAVSYPEVGRVLRTMREAGRRLFVVSNKPRHIALPILERQGIQSYFEQIVTRDSRSPFYETKEEMLLTLLHNQIQPNDCVVVGDTLEDANAAARVGIQFILLEHGYGSFSEIPPDQVTHSLKNFSQFYELLTKEPVLD